MVEHGYKLTDDAVVIVQGRVDGRDEAPKLICMEVSVVRGDLLERPAAAAQAAGHVALRGAHRPAQADPGRASGRVARLPPPRRGQGAAPARRVPGRSGPCRRRAAGGLRARRRRSSDAARPRSAAFLAAFRDDPSEWQNGDPPGSSGDRRRAGAHPAPDLPGAVTKMAIQVDTKDSTALTDADLDEMASMGGAFEIGLLSKAKEDWVLCTQARIEGKLHGFTFSTLERIGGTPCVLLGLMSVKRTSKRDDRAEGTHGRGLPPGADGLPGRGRAGRHPLRHRGRRRGAPAAHRHHPPPGPPCRGRGAGLGPAAGQALRGRGGPTTSRPSS